MPIHSHASLAYFEVPYASVSQLEGAAFLRLDFKPAQCGSWQNGVGGPGINQDVYGLVTFSPRIADLYRHVETPQRCSPYHEGAALFSLYQDAIFLPEHTLEDLA